MDKNTVIGLVLIFLILIGFSYFNRPSEAEMQERHRQDSIARVEQRKMLEAERQRQEEAAATVAAHSGQTGGAFLQDSLAEQVYTLENDKIRLDISTRGGRIVLVDLKEYRTHDSLPLVLWREGATTMGLSFYARNQEINTEKLLFVSGATEQTQYARNGEQVLSMRLYAEEDKYIEYLYKLSPDSYMVDFSVITHNMDDVIAAKSSFLTLNWGIHMPQLEKSKDFEKRYTGVYYKFFEDDVENLSLTSDEKETLTTKVQWIDFKQQFFSSILIAQKPFNDVELALTNSDEAGYLKYAAAEIPLPYNGDENERYDMRFFFGPNAYTVLKEY